jgi:hypothetical protein
MYIPSVKPVLEFAEDQATANNKQYICSKSRDRRPRTPGKAIFTEPALKDNPIFFFFI